MQGIATSLSIVVVSACFSASLSAQSFDRLRLQHLPDRRDHTENVAAADFDGDGDLDLVTANGGLGPVPSRLLLNDGHGVFTESTAMLGPDDVATAADAGDLDGDGDIDLVLGRDRPFGSGGWIVLLNDGTGSFTSGPEVVSNSLSTFDLELADLDADGDLDIIESADTAVMWRNEGNLVFTPQPLGIASFVYGDLEILDLEGDGDLDLVAAARIGPASGPRVDVLRNDGSLPFTTVPSVSSIDATDLAVGDADGDGDADVLVTVRFAPATGALLLNDGAGNFTPSAALPDPLRATSASLTDVDGDLDQDVVLATRAGARLLVNDGSALFTVATPDRLPFHDEETTAITAADLDGDGDRDLFVGTAVTQSKVAPPTSERLNRLFLNDGTGAFVDAASAAIPESDNNVLVVTRLDADGDGLADLYVANSPVPFATSDGANELFLARPDGRFDAAPASIPSKASGTRAVATGDVDGDGDPDLIDLDTFVALPITTLNNNVSFRVLTNDGAGSFTTSQFEVLPFAGFNDLALGDADGDGDLDLFIGAADADLLFSNDGVGNFTQTAGRLPMDFVDSQDLELADADHDGDLDLFVLGPTGARIYINDGLGTFTNETATRLPGVTGALIALVDLEADGDPDLIGDTVQINDGTGNFVDDTAARYPPLSPGSTRTATDIDGDGDLDVVRSNATLLDQGSGFFVEAPAPTGLPFDEVLFVDVDEDGDTDAIGLGELGGNGTDGVEVSSNLTRQLFAPRLPGVGLPFTLRAYSRPVVPVGTTPPPSFVVVFAALGPGDVDLGPIGRLRLDLATLLTLPSAMVPTVDGFVDYTLPLANQPALQGLELFFQGAVVAAPPASPGIALTNVIGVRIVR